MTRARLLVAGCLVLPLAVDVPAVRRDSTAGRFSVAGGMATIAIVERGCEGQVLRTDRAHVRDASVALEHRVVGAIKAGVRGGLVRIRGYTAHYINPHLALEWTYAGLGGGYLRSPEGLPTNDLFDTFENFTSFHLRFGRLDAIHFRVEAMESEPLVTGGGYVVIGFGFAPKASRARAFVGVSGGPYDGAGAVLRVDYRVAPEVLLEAKARFGGSAGVSENAIAVGITLETFRRAN